MSRLTKLFRAVSLETQQQDLAAARPLQDEQIERALAEAEQSGQFQRACDKYEALTDIAESLEGVVAAIEEYRDTGLTPDAAYYLNHVVDMQSRRAGLTQPATPSLEQYVGYRARTSTSIALEGVQLRLSEVRALRDQAAAERDALKPAA